MKVTLPEQVDLEYEPASFGSRALSYLLDFTVRWGVFFTLLLVLLYIMSFLTHSGMFSNLEHMVPEAIKKSSSSGLYFFSFISIIFFLVEWSYPIYFEVWRDGATPGKRAFGLRVIDEHGLNVTFTASLIRTILLTVDLVPGSALVGFLSMVTTKRSQRLGDLVAKTLVVHELVEHKSKDVQSEGNIKTIALPLERYQILEAYMKRSKELTGSPRAATRAALVKALIPFASHLDPPRAGDEVIEEAWLLNVFANSKPEKKRYSEFKREESVQWRSLDKDIQQCAVELEKLRSHRGALSANLLRHGAETYQTLCQKLAYLTTFYPDTEPTKNASSLVRSGRRLIYGSRLSSTTHKETNILLRAPIAFHELLKYCLISIALMGMSGLLAAWIVAINPALSWHFLSEDVVSDLSKGKLWTEGIQGMSPLASSKIMTNNISVSLLAFASGITGGVGTVVLLVFNGALLGGMFMALTQYSMAGRLLDFVVAHGIIELSIIAIAGGCGLAIGDAIIHPGSLSRKRALQERARTAIDLLFFSALCLVPAGITEGYISPYLTIPFAMKLMWGLVLGGAYWGYLIFGGVKPTKLERIERQ